MRVTTLFINSVFCWSRKMATIFILASEVSLRSISLFAPDVFIISGLRSSGAYDAFSTFFHRQYCLLVTKDGHNDYLSVERFLLTSLSEFALATSWFLVYESLKSIVRVTTLFIISVVCWSTKQKSSQSLSWRRKVRWLRSLCLLLAFSSILVRTARKRKLIFTTLLITTVVCWSPKTVIMIIFQSKVFHWHLCQSLLLANSWFLVYEALERIMFFTTLCTGSFVDIVLAVCF